MSILSRKLMASGGGGLSYDAANATPNGVSFTLTARGGPVRFKPDGTKMYSLAFSGGPVYQYTLSTPWDLSTASYDSVSWTIPTITGAAYRGMFFKPDGTKVFLLDDNSASSGLNPKAREYPLSTAWDISSAGSETASFNVGSQTTSPNGMAFNDEDGTKFYIISNKTIWEYDLSTPWVISTASYSSATITISEIASFGGREMQFNEAGDQLFTIGQGDVMDQIELSTPWDITTASHLAQSSSFVPDLGDQDYYGISLSPVSPKAFISSSTTPGVVYEISM